MRFIHFSNTPITKLRNSRQNKQYSLKPRGLWISDEDDYGWKEWCSIHAPNCLGKEVYSVELHNNAKLLWLKTLEDIDAFTYVYKRTGEPWDSLQLMIPIDWYTVAQEYDGIIITPYQPKRYWAFNGAAWYSPWDVASGCIWKASAIKRIEAI